MSRIPLFVALTVAALSQPLCAAEYERSGVWVYQSQAFAEIADGTLNACTASTESADGTALVFRLEPEEGGGFSAGLSFENTAWQGGARPVRVRLDIGAARWVLPAEAEGDAVVVTWTGDAALLPFLEDLASSSFARLVGRNGAAVAQFSLTGSRGAIEAMKSCAETQIGQGLEPAIGAGADPDGLF